MHWTTVAQTPLMRNAQNYRNIQPSTTIEHQKRKIQKPRTFFFPVLQFFSATKQKRRKKVPRKRHEVATFFTGPLRRMGLRGASIFFCFGGVLATISFFPRENNSQMVGLKLSTQHSSLCLSKIRSFSL